MNRRLGQSVLLCLAMGSLAWASDAPGSATQPATAAAVEPADSPEARPIETRPVGRRESSQATDDGLVRTLLALGAVVVAILLVRYVLRRMGMAQPVRGATAGMEVASSLRIGPRHQLLMVRMGRRVVLVGSGPEGMSPLAEVSDPAEVQELLSGGKASGPSQGPAAKGGQE